MKKLTLLTIALWSAAAGASDFPRVDADFKAYDEHLAQLQQEFARKPPAPDDKKWVKEKLAHMAEVALYLRTKDTLLPRGYSEDERAEHSRRVRERVEKIDPQNTAELKALMKTWRWFTISEFGWQGDHNAWLLVRNADHDVTFQRQVLTILEPLAATGETNPKSFAYLHDRVSRSPQNPAGRMLQRYGTQGRCTQPGKWEPYPVEDPEHLDARRAEVRLPPIAVDKNRSIAMCYGPEGMRKVATP